MPAGKVKSIKKTAEFRRVYTKGKLHKGVLLCVYVLPVEQKQTRTGVSISKRISKKATDRNKFKRVIKEWLRQNAPALLKEHADVVVSVRRKPEAGRAGTKQVREELAKLLTK